MATGQVIAEKQAPNTYRSLYLLVFHAHPFNAHWAFWTPAQDQAGKRSGKWAHAQGSPLTGFTIEFRRNHDLDSEDVAPSIIELGQMDANDLCDTPLDGEYVEDDDVPRDAFERTACDVPAPGKAMRSVADGTQAGARMRRKVLEEDCQFWVKGVVELLVQRGMLFPPKEGKDVGQDPRQIASSAPVH